MNIAAINTNPSLTITHTREPATMQIVQASKNIRTGDTVEITPRPAGKPAPENQASERAMNIKSQALRRMAERLITEQYAKGNHLFMIFYGGKALELDPTLRPENPALDLERQTVVDTANYFGPNQTSQRILSAAADIAGPDSAAPQTGVVDLFRSSVRAAFENVRKSFDGVMPELTQRTYTAAMKAFDAWESGGKPD